MSKVKSMFDIKETDLFELEDDDFDTIMESDIKFTGSIRFAKPFMIRGIVDGTITATSDLVIDTNAKVKANIETNRVLVKGSVTGNITGKKTVYVTSTGSVEGDITAAQVVLEPGSSFTGKCTTVKA